LTNFQQRLKLGMNGTEICIDWARLCNNTGFCVIVALRMWCSVSR